MALSTDDDGLKELTRKLFWAIDSSRKLTRSQKADCFKWAARLAERVIERHPSHPPPVDTSKQSSYTGLADGRGGGRDKSSIQRPSRRSPPPDMPAWERRQAEMREKAWGYVDRAGMANGQYPIPSEVYREVSNGRSNSTG